VYLYYIKSYASVGNLIDLVDGKQRITKLKGVAAVAGRRALSAYNDVACLVTVSWSKKKIVITRVDYR
jgi:hypothetical protein